jgi:uncharacterized protein (DUF1684 family)
MRIANLKDPGGYLNQIGLYWLEPGSYSFGSDDSNDVVFGGDSAPKIGVFTVDNDGVSMVVTSGVDVQSDGESVSEMGIPADTSDEGVMITHRSLAWSVVERIGRFAIRLRDFDHPFVATFGPLPYFDIDSGLRVEARLRRYA